MFPNAPIKRRVFRYRPTWIPTRRQDEAPKPSRLRSTEVLGMVAAQPPWSEVQDCTLGGPHTRVCRGALNLNQETFLPPPQYIQVYRQVKQRDNQTDQQEALTRNHHHLEVLPAWERKTSQDDTVDLTKTKNRTSLPTRVENSTSIAPVPSTRQ